MTIEQTIEKKRNDKGEFIQVIPEGWRSKTNLYQKTYLSEHPWARHYSFSKGRAGKLGIEHTMKVADFKKLWERDYAFRLLRPSIDRIDSKRGYIYENCRFIELSENCRRDKIGRPTSDKQRETARKNLTGWRKKHENK